MGDRLEQTGRRTALLTLSIACPPQHSPRWGVVVAISHHKGRKQIYLLVLSSERYYLQQCSMPLKIFGKGKWRRGLPSLSFMLTFPCLITRDEQFGLDLDRWKAS